MLPKTLRNFNLHIGADSFAGIVDEINIPKLTKKTEEYIAGGMLAPTEIVTQFEKLETDFTMREYNDILIENFNKSSIPLKFSGSLLNNNTGEEETIEISMTGFLKELDLGSAKMGEMTTIKVAVAIDYYKYVSNGNDLLEIDTKNLIHKVKGEDQLKNLRTNIGL